MRPYRDELVLSTKAGYDMWPGPYGQGGGSRKYLLASLDQSLARMGVDYVDIFYSHRFDPDTPLEETMGALDTAVRSGQALYAGISSYSPERTREAAAILRDLGTPLLIHQPSYSMLNRWIEEDAARRPRRGGRRLHRVLPARAGDADRTSTSTASPRARARRRTSRCRPTCSPSRRSRHVRALNDIAAARGQTLAQLALAWALRDRRVTSVLIGASSVEQLDDSLGALDRPRLHRRRAGAIDEHAVDAGINLWAASAER